MRVRPVTPDLLVDEIVDQVAAVAAGGAARVAVDGAPETGTGGLADALVEPLRVRGHEAIRVTTADYLRAASLRLEHGHQDPDSYFLDWFDLDGLSREVLQPLEPGGSGRVLPALWDAERDRSPRVPRVPVPEGGVVLVDGPLLLGRGLAFDWAAHLWMPLEILARRVPDERRWRLPAFARYERESAPGDRADRVVRVDRPGHPAVIDSW